MIVPPCPEFLTELMIRLTTCWAIVFTILGLRSAQGFLAASLAAMCNSHSLERTEAKLAGSQVESKTSCAGEMI